MAWFESGGGSGEIKEMAHFSRYGNTASGAGYQGLYYDNLGNYNLGYNFTQENPYIKTVIATSSNVFDSVITFYAVQDGTYEYIGMDNTFSQITKNRVQKSAGEVIFSYNAYNSIGYCMADLSVWAL